MNNATKWRPLGTSAQERMNNPTTCGCCGREGLKKTVKMGADGAVVWMGTGCAAKAAGVGISEFKVQLAAADDAVLVAERAAWKAGDDAWQGFLDLSAPGLDRFDQIQKLGGMKAARAAFQAAGRA